jgi:serine/threonine protein kinase/flagellar basal body-associated protein FliL
MPQFCPECARTFDDDTLRLCPHDGSRVFSLERGKDPMIGLVIDDRFRIEKLIGEGGMGSVYRGVQLSVNRDVAIKLLRPELQNRDIALERFFREARTISQLTHPNIVRLIDFGQDREHDLLYLVMELVAGFDLADLIAQGRMRVPLALDIAHQICGALSEPHGLGVIHRDLKPDNILVVPMADGTVQVKVLDFGIARALEQNTQITATGMVCGTPAYMAPEQAQNETLDLRADIYAMGVIFFEMLSGWPPFTGTNSLQVMIKHIQEEAPTLRDLLPGGSLPASIEALTASLLAKSRDKRPATARIVRDRIEEIQREMNLTRVPAEAGMTFAEASEAWLLPKLPHGDELKSGPTEALRHETDMERYLTKVDDDRPTNIYPQDTRDEIYPTTPLQNPDIILADRVKVGARGSQNHSNSLEAFARTEMSMQTPESVPSGPSPTAERGAPDSTVEGVRPKALIAAHDSKLSFIAIGVGFVTLMVAAGVVSLFFSNANKPEVINPPIAAAPVEPVVAVVASAAPVVDLARTSLQIAVKDASISQMAEHQALLDAKIKPTKTKKKDPEEKSPQKSADVPKNVAPVEPSKTDPKKGPTEKSIFGEGGLRGAQ